MEDPLHIVAQMLAHSGPCIERLDGVLRPMCNGLPPFFGVSARSQSGRIDPFRPIIALSGTLTENPGGARFGGWRYRAAFPVHHIKHQVMAFLAKIAVGIHWGQRWNLCGSTCLPVVRKTIRPTPIPARHPGKGTWAVRRLACFPGQPQGSCMLAGSTFGWPQLPGR